MRHRAPRTRYPCRLRDLRGTAKLGIATITTHAVASSKDPISQLRHVARYASVVKLPLDRERMRERNLLDDIDELELAAAQTPEERLVDALDLSDLALALYSANPDAPVIDRLEDLQEKARLWGAPLVAITP